MAAIALSALAVLVVLAVLAVLVACLQCVGLFHSDQHSQSIKRRHVTPSSPGRADTPLEGGRANKLTKDM